MLTKREFMAGMFWTAGCFFMGVKPTAAKMEGSMKVEKISLSKEEWQKKLTEEQYAILREEGTERAFSSPLDKEYRPGIYHCAGCDLPLFTSTMKFDSGTGWPSFYTTIAEHVATKVDFKLLYPRTEYHCARCEGHQGHVFKDGPQPTYQRWCNNGLALRFEPETTA